MKRTWLMLPAVVAGMALWGDSVEAQGVQDSARRHVAAVFEREGVPGMAVTVSIGTVEGTSTWREGFGFADVESRTPATAETRFRVGSVSKLLTAVALMRLVEAGRVDLDASISQYVSGLPDRLGEATLRQLAGHQGGVRHYSGREFLTDQHFETLRDALRVFADDSLIAVPGTRYAYSSYGYNLIGAVLEAATGLSFPELIEREVLTPVGMVATVPDVRDAAVEGRATTYHLGDAGAVMAPADDLSGRWPSGGYLSTTDDLVRLGRALLEPGLLDPASLAVMFTPQRLASGEETSVGIGWRVGADERGRRYLHHGGSSNGGAAFLLIYPEEQLVLAMASNAFGRWGEREALEVAVILLGL